MVKAERCRTAVDVKVFDSIEKIPADQWKNVVPLEFPFAQRAFLLALEQTDCLGARTGWVPIYLTLWESNELLAALPLFSKTNSYGEYIYDFAWAQAYDSVGLEYYPKFTTAIPFTSATGPKILFSKKLNEGNRHSVALKLISAAEELSQKVDVSSLHALFITQDEIPFFKAERFFIRHSFQYHWLNDDYESFTDFLQALRSKRRKEILRERNQVFESGLRISRLTGDHLTTAHAEAMYLFYESTAMKKGGFTYLTPDFFRQIFDTMRDSILFVLAEKPDGKPVAGALNFFGPTTLFGRNWGCLEEHKALHLEICYYQGIEFAIERKLQLFEAGAQGEHKFRRGFLPRLTYSAHKIRDSRLSQAIGNFIEEEKRQIEFIFEDYRQQSPFSRDQSSPLSRPRRP